MEARKTHILQTSCQDRPTSNLGKGAQVERPVRRGLPIDNRDELSGCCMRRWNGGLDYKGLSIEQCGSLSMRSHHSDTQDAH